MERRTSIERKRKVDDAYFYIETDKKRSTVKKNNDVEEKTNLKKKAILNTEVYIKNLSLIENDTTSYKKTDFKKKSILNIKEYINVSKNTDLKKNAILNTKEYTENLLPIANLSLIKNDTTLSPALRRSFVATSATDNLFKDVIA